MLNDQLFPEQLALEKTKNRTGRIIFTFDGEGTFIILVPKMDGNSTLNKNVKVNTS